MWKSLQFKQHTKVNILVISKEFQENVQWVDKIEVELLRGEKHKISRQAKSVLV